MNDNPTPHPPDNPPHEARAVSAYTRKEKVARALWMLLGQPAFRCTFHNWYPLRAAILRRFGATIAPNVRLMNTVTIEQPWNISIGANTAVGHHAILYALGPITLAENVSISQYAHLCAGTHDYTRPDMPLLRPPIVVEREAWIAADAFIGPGVTVREGSIVGARASVFRDTQPWMIHTGNPARAVKDRAFHGR